MDTKRCEDWASNTIVLDQAQWLTSTLRVKFEFQAKGGNNIYLDNINLVGQSGVGIEKLSAQTLNANLFPNPTTSGVTVTLDAEKADALDLNVVDAQGRVVMQHNGWNVQTGSNSFPLALNGAARGWYIVTIQGASGFVRLPLLVQ